MLCHRAGNCRNNGDCQRRNQRLRQVVHRKRLGIVHAKQLIGLGQAVSDRLQTGYDHGGINQRGQTGDRVCQGNRDDQPQQAMHQLTGRAAFSAGRTRMTRRVTHVIDPDTDRSHGLTDGDTQNGQCRAHLDRQIAEHADGGKAQAQKQLAQCLNQLAHRSGQHVGLALIVAAHDRDAGDKEYRRCDRLHRQNGCRVFDEVTQPRRTEEQERRAQRTQRNKDQSGDTHDRTNLTIASEGIGLGNHLGQRDRYAGCRDNEHRGIELISDVKDAHALVQQQVLQGNLKQRTDHLDQHIGHDQDDGTL